MWRVKGLIHTCALPVVLHLNQVAVQQLYEFRDHYFEHNSTDKAVLKNEETQAKLKETLVVLDYVQGESNLFCHHTIFSRINAGGVYLKLDLIDSVFI